MIDRIALLSTLKPAVARLEASIDQRIAETPAVAERLRLEHHRAEAAERTAMSLEEWQSGEVTQAAVAWVLACVFVRFLEDNRLVDEPLITGLGQRGEAALGHRSNYFQQQPGHSDREYLESAFREIARHPAVAPLYDDRHNPLWRLGPTADGARELRETFTAIDPATGDLAHDFTDPGLDTRFLGDLYQDLSEAAKKRYALLQTPDFVESFILDRTLTPAIDEFGLGEVRLIDPTSGSGHFLIGAFYRLFALWQEREPGTTATVLAQRALDQIAGVDLNPYATAIARFRLLVAALKACGITRLAEAPAFALNLATGDSLLHGPLPFEGAGALFDAGRLDKNIAHVYESEDADELKRILGRGYHVVVGNPPYITGEDRVLRNAYRARYQSCYREFALTVPFMERFFELAQVRGDDGRNRGGFVGKITSNSFMRREFGSPLVETFLPSVDLQIIIDASGAFIPGHGTPTVLLLGRSRPPASEWFRVVDAVQGEPRQPKEPARGPVWASITTNVDVEGASDAYTRCSRVARAELSLHPMTLGIGRDVRKRVEAASRTTVGNLGAVGFVVLTGDDDFYVAPAEADLRRAGASQTAALVEGTAVRDWSLDVKGVMKPHDGDWNVGLPDGAPDWRLYWPQRTGLRARRRFGVRMEESGRTWFEWREIYPDKLRTPLTLTWGEVSTHNHFVLDRGDKVFKQTAPVIKLPEGASEEEHLALLGVLNEVVP